MADGYRIIGAGMSCSVKIRCYFRYKGMPHQWMIPVATGCPAGLRT
jgi:hypothetical protein